MKIRSQRDFLSGPMFIAIGAGFAIGATTYSMGTSARPGALLSADAQRDHGDPRCDRPVQVAEDRARASAGSVPRAQDG